MIINNKHVQGVFRYSPSSEYEKGDFVICNEIMYVCTAKNPTDPTKFTVFGESPEESLDNFEIYLGKKVSGVDEYLSFVSDPKGKEDLYITAQTLSGVLNHYMSGFDEKGYINNSIKEVGNNTFLTLGGASPIECSNIFNTLITKPELNNAIFKVSRSTVSKFLPDLGNVSEVLDGDKNYVVLRQYTFEGEYDNYRVQEIVDFMTGNVLFRYCVNNSINTVSTWKSSIIDQDFKQSVDFVKNYYYKQLENLDLKERSMEGNFGFRNCSVPKTDSITVQCTKEGDPCYIKTDTFSKPTLITVLVQEASQFGLFRNTSITIDLSDILGEDKILQYYVSDSCSISVGQNPSSKSITLNLTKGTRFLNIYYRDFLK